LSGTFFLKYALRSTHGISGTFGKSIKGKRSIVRLTVWEDASRNIKSWESSIVVTREVIHDAKLHFTSYRQGQRAMKHAPWIICTIILHHDDLVVCHAFTPTVRRMHACTCGLSTNCQNSPYPYNLQGINTSSWLAVRERYYFRPRAVHHFLKSFPPRDLLNSSAAFSLAGIQTTRIVSHSLTLVPAHNANEDLNTLSCGLLRASSRSLL
jgi:hypothetical protein